METIKNNQKRFANYLRKIENPTDWNVKLLGEFPGTFTNYQRYFELILKENKNKEKIDALNKQYNLLKYETIERKVEIINGQPRSIQNFFSGTTIKGKNEKKYTLPHEKKMEFIAILFESPIRTLNEFLEYEEN